MPYQLYVSIKLKKKLQNSNYDVLAEHPLLSMFTVQLITKINFYINSKIRRCWRLICGIASCECESHTWEE